MRNLFFVSLLVIAMPAFGARVDYVYTGNDELGLSIDLQGEQLNAVLSRPAPVGSTIEAVGNLFMFTKAPWIASEVYQTIELSATFRGDETFSISPSLLAEVVPFVVIGGESFYVNTDVPGFLNGVQMDLSLHPEGNNYILDLSSAQPIEVTLDVIVHGDGVVSKDPDSASYSLGEQVTLRAEPAANSVFGGWVVVGNDDWIAENSTLHLSMTNQTTVVAIFCPGQLFNADINGDGAVNAIDVQLAINAALGKPIEPSK